MTLKGLGPSCVQASLPAGSAKRHYLILPLNATLCPIQYGFRFLSSRPKPDYLIKLSIYFFGIYNGRTSDSSLLAPLPHSLFRNINAFHDGTLPFPPINKALFLYRPQCKLLTSHVFWHRIAKCLLYKKSYWFVVINVISQVGEQHFHIKKNGTRF